MKKFVEALSQLETSKPIYKASNVTWDNTRSAVTFSLASHVKQVIKDEDSLDLRIAKEHFFEMLSPDKTKFEVNYNAAKTRLISNIESSIMAFIGRHKACKYPDKSKVYRFYNNLSSLTLTPEEEQKVYEVYKYILSQNDEEIHKQNTLKILEVIKAQIENRVK